MKKVNYQLFLHNDLVYCVPEESTGKFSDGTPRYDSGMAGWWTYHFNQHEYFNIVFNGFKL